MNVLPAFPTDVSARPHRLTGPGFAAIAIGIGFNIPYALLTMNFDYPGVLRRPASEALALFAAGGPALIATWYGFAVAAIALIPIAIALAITPRRLATRPALAIGAAIAGALSGLVQAIGLLRWVFAVPMLAQARLAADADPLAGRAATLVHEVLNLWGGVAIGEHLGQILLALFVGQLALLQHDEARPLQAGIGLTTAGALLVGSLEGPALALGAAVPAFTSATIAGFLGLTLWLLLTGWRHRDG